MKIEGSTFVVTGGGSGLGEATVRLLHARGAAVVIADVAVEKGEALAAELGARTAFVRCDITDEAEVNAALGRAAAFGPLRGVIGCAGIAVGEKVLGKDGPHRQKSFARCIEVNLLGTFNVVRLAAAAMAETPACEDGERGVIVSTASVAAYEGQIGQAAYAASKAGIVGMTLPIARDLMNEGIRVNTILPGIFNTPLLQGAPENVKAALSASVPFPKRLGMPEEYAQLALTMITNGYFNGEDVRLDGAIRMAPR